MRIAVALVVVLAVAPAAQALRGVEPETKCSEISNVERRRGSILRSDLGPGPNDSILISYSGTHAGHPAEILYQCSGTDINAQLVTVRLKDQEEATSLYLAELDRLLRLYGPPTSEETDFCGENAAACEQLNSFLGVAVLREAHWYLENRSLAVRLGEVSANQFEVSVLGP